MRLTELCTEVKAKLDYFLELEDIIRTLNRPSGNFVQSTEFVNLLSTMDRAIAFLRSHPDYRDSDIYLVKYQQCMIRSLGMIKSFGIDTLKESMNEIKMALAGRKVVETEENIRDALLYLKFKNLALKIQPLIYQLEKRALREHAYYGLFKDFISHYFWTRQSLVSQWINLELEKLGAVEDHVVMVSSNLIYRIDDS
jgi:conserved oligomeric Golgi complex subunit 3